ncbi:MAG: multicopper oxidase family protein [Myxococcota bacterium]
MLSAIIVLVGGVGCSDGASAPPDIQTHIADDHDASPDPAIDAVNDANPDVSDSDDATQAPVALPEVLAPAVAEDLDPDPHVVEVSLTAKKKRVEILPHLVVEMWTYNGSIPGPLIHCRVGDEVIVHFQNDLPEPTTVHWHGLRIPADMDGSPRIQDPIPAGGSFTYRFTPPDAGSFWYHPHVKTNEQIEKGLYGLFVVHEAEDPSVDADRYIALDDILLDTDGLAPFLSDMMEEMHGRTGNTLLTNGQVDALELTATKGRVERWRLVNTANARTMELTLEGASWRVMGTDGGLIATPYGVGRLVLPVGQRYDLEVTYDQAGTAELQSHVLTVNDHNQVEELAIPVVSVAVAESAAAPTVAAWPTVPALPARVPTDSAELVLDAKSTSQGIEWMINGESMPMDPLFEVAKGSTMTIVLKNKQVPEHPFHLHGQFFEIAKRNGKAVTDEPGLKDTVLIHGSETVELRAYMDNPGRWMAHCHILEHSELGMMGEFLVDDLEAP